MPPPWLRQGGRGHKLFKGGGGGGGALSSLHSFDCGYIRGSSKPQAT